MYAGHPYRPLYNQASSKLQMPGICELSVQYSGGKRVANQLFPPVRNSENKLFYLLSKQIVSIPIVYGNMSTGTARFTV